MKPISPPWWHLIVQGIERETRIPARAKATDRLLHRHDGAVTLLRAQAHAMEWHDRRIDPIPPPVSLGDRIARIAKR